MKDVSWLSARGGELTLEEWTAHSAQSFGMLRQSLSDPDERLLLLFNPCYEAVDFAIPAATKWELLVDTGRPGAGYDRAYDIFQGTCYKMPPQTLVLLRHKGRRP